MKILFSPEYTGHVFLGLNEQQPEVMDTMVCDTMGLIATLELRLGIHVEAPTGTNRMILYYKSLLDYMHRHPDNILAPSFELSPLGTSERALQWRDNLMLDKWTPQTPTNSKRLEVIAGVEANFDVPGLPDRLYQVLNALNRVGDQGFADLEIITSCDSDLFHPAINQLLQALNSHGATISYQPATKTGDTNLAKVAQLLQSSTKGKINLNKGDKSFLIYHFQDENAANEYLALKGEEIAADVWVNDNNKAMDNWLRMMGKPTMGSDMPESVPQLVQLFVLGIDMMKEPLNIQSLISWLYSPMQPFGPKFGKILAEKIIKEGGYRNEGCQQVVAQYIAGEYAFHDKEQDAKLSEKELINRNAKEQKERTQLVKTYLPPFEVDEDAPLKTIRLTSYLNSLSSWASQRSHLLREKPDNEGWLNQLDSLAKMCDSFILLLNASDMGDIVDWKLVENWISTLYHGESFMQYVAQRDSRMLIENPAKMATHSKRTVWMNFHGNKAHAFDCSFLYPSEKAQIKQQLILWNELKEADYHHQMELTPLLMTDDQLILVTTDYLEGKVAPKHPFMVQLETQVENLDEFILSPNLYDEDYEGVLPICNTNYNAQITFKKADLLKWPDHISPTIISTLIEYPLDFMMERLLNINGTGPRSLADVKTTKGTVAHAVIEALFKPRDGRPCSTPDEIEARIKAEFDDQLRKQIEACGAILYLPENKLDTDHLSEQLKKCLDVLLDILRENHLNVTDCEHEVWKDMGLLKNEKGDMKGFLDMTLEDENHHPVVFDFKWTSSRTYYRDLINDNRSIQLELYRDMLSTEKRDAVEKVAYFLMPEAHLYSKEHFNGRHCTQLEPESKRNVVEQLKRSFFYRKRQLDAGMVEVGEKFPFADLEYYRDTEEQDLFPLKEDDKNKGYQKENQFSNYKLFKGFKPEEEEQ